MDAGVLPVKRLDRAKRRLGPGLDASQRRSVARALFEAALELCTSADFLEWLVVSDDPDVLATAASRGFRTLEDRGEGLNPALELAVPELRARGATSMTVLPADVPLALREDLVDILDTGATSDVVLVPSEGDGGTNALYVSPPDLLALSFGDNSLTAYVRAAESIGARCAILPLERLSLDLDTPDDLRELLARSPGGRASEVLSRYARAMR